MLRVMRRGAPGVLRAISAAEDRALRLAFGRNAKSAEREAGIRVVREHQHAVGGQWFACDCLGGAAPPPVLVPVAESFVRRHVEPPWPEHADWCDFYRHPEEQHAVSTSFRRPVRAGAPLRLVRAFARPEPLERVVRRVGADRGRPRLAALLFDLVERAGLTVVTPGVIPAVTDQFRAVRRAAEDVEIDAGVSLANFLCLYPPALGKFVEKIGRTRTPVFRHAGRPHGVLVGVASSAACGQIVPVHGEPFEVAGAISIFGEPDGHAEGRRAPAGERAPYLMACVVGRRQPEEPVQVLRAYLHPCMSPTWLLPVDSACERGTLRQLLSLGRWLSEKAVSATIEKPLFDLVPPVIPAPGAEAEPREPVIPDFIVRAPGRAVVVETMGYDLPAYRERKARMHAEMSRLCGGAPVVEHDFCLTADDAQDERDRSFWRACARRILAQPIPPAA